MGELGELGWDRTLSAPDRFLFWVRDVDLGRCVRAIVNVRRQNNTVNSLDCPVVFIDADQDYRVDATLGKDVMPGNSNVEIWLDLTMNDNSTLRSPTTGEVNVRRNDL